MITSIIFIPIANSLYSKRANNDLSTLHFYHCCKNAWNNVKAMISTHFSIIIAIQNVTDVLKAMILCYLMFLIALRSSTTQKRQWFLHFFKFPSPHWHFQQLIDNYFKLYFIYHRFTATNSTMLLMISIVQRISVHENFQTAPLKDFTDSRRPEQGAGIMIIMIFPYRF